MFYICIQSNNQNMTKYLAFIKEDDSPKWPTKVIEIDAENVHVAFSMITSIEDKANLAFVTISEEDPNYPWPAGEVYTKSYLENPAEYDILGELPF